MSSPALAELSDGDLLAGTRRLVGASNHLFANLLAHLAEVEARGIHRTRACSSLYTYCVYELRFSEDAAFRRVSAARLVRRFPALFDAIASGELHLTAVLMLGPHLTPENVVEVLARAKHRTKREIGQLLRELDPLPDVPARIEPRRCAGERTPAIEAADLGNVRALVQPRSPSHSRRAAARLDERCSVTVRERLGIAERRFGAERAFGAERGYGFDRRGRCFGERGDGIRGRRHSINNRGCAFDRRGDAFDG